MRVRRRFRLRTLAAVFAIAVPACAGIWAAPARAEIVVFAAASTANAIDAIGTAFAASGGGRIRASYGSSGALARQIESGAPAAVFLSADERWMNDLARQGLIAAGTRRDLLGNALVLIAPAASPVKAKIAPGFPLAALLGGGRLAMGEPGSVPAGIYARQALEHLGVWQDVKDRLAPGQSVRYALAFVERGESPLGIVYATDAAISSKVRVVAAFPEGSHPPIRYPIALIAGNDTAEARAFAAFLRGSAARAIFTRFGFQVF